MNGQGTNQSEPMMKLRAKQREGSNMVSDVLRELKRSIEQMIGDVEAPPYHISGASNGHPPFEFPSTCRVLRIITITPHCKQY